MASSFGGTIKLTGESEYRKALNNISNNLKVLNSELKMTSSAYDKNDKSVSNLSQQNTVLNKKIDEQKNKVKILEQALQDAQDIYSKNTKEVDRYESELSEAKTKLASLESQQKSSKGTNESLTKAIEQQKNVVASLEKDLEGAKKETDASSNTTKKWQTDLNNAKAELNRLSGQIQKNESEMANYSEATQEASQSTITFGDLLKANLINDAVVAGVSAIGDAVKKVGQALIDVGKQAVSGYGEYEQLVGGVETLFGKSAPLVQKYASEAYATAGISANEYMEQVTNFSASLLNSLSGDTEASAKYANMAVIDMSDNMNKMGTSMDSIQNAYQGFAKQNYTINIMSA